MAKKKQKELVKHRAKFKKAGPEKGVSEEVAEQIFNDIDFFARYGFNKSHAADYAVLTVQTAFLKAHFPHEYMTALLTIERGDTDKVGSYIADCRRMDIEVLPPDINSSDHDFVIEQFEDGARAIRYGLSAIKNVGEGSVDAVLEARGEGPFVDLPDFCKRTDLREVGKRALESLIKVGALDGFAQRLQMLDSLDRIMHYSSGLHKAAEAGQMSLFGESTGVTLNNTDAGGILVDSVQTEVSRRELLQWERDLVGVYVSEHPMQTVMGTLEDVVSTYTKDLTEADHERPATMAGVVKNVRPHVTKTNKPMAFVVMEDLYGEFEVLVWPSTWDETKELWQVDRILLVRGKIDAERGEPKLLCDEATTNFSLWQSADKTQRRSGQRDRQRHHEAAPSTTDQPSPPPEENYYDAPPPEVVAETTRQTAPGNGHEGRRRNGRTDGHESGNGRQPNQAQSDHNPAPADTSQTAADPETSAPPATSPYQQQPAAEHQAAQQPAPTLKQRDEEQPARIRVTVACGDSPERDKRRLQRLHGLMISYPGEDRFTFVLEYPDRTVEVDFSNVTTHYCPDLEERLIRIVGTDAIQIIQ